jgi:PleD family two-component response regulator
LISSRCPKELSAREIDKALEAPVGSVDGLANRAKRPRILVADDNADMRSYISYILAGAACDIEMVSDGKAALAAA